MVFQPDQDQCSAIVTDIRLTDSMADNLTNSEKYMVVENATRVLLNTVPANQMNRNDLKAIHKRLWKSNNFIQPHEMLGCHCIAEFVICIESLKT